MKHVGRKLYHLIGGLVLLSLYFLFGRPASVVIYAVLFLFVLAVEIVRLRDARFNQFIRRRFSSFIRESEATRFTGTAPYVLGVGLTLLLYRTDIAAAAVCFLAFGDVAATAVGERWGRTKISGTKSLEGTLAFFAAAALSGVLLQTSGIHLPHGLILAGALVAACVEILPLPVNDNLAIPVVSGGAMELLARLTGCA